MLGENVENYLLKKNFAKSKTGVMANGAVIQQIPVPSQYVSMTLNFRFLGSIVKL